MWGKSFLFKALERIKPVAKVYPPPASVREQIIELRRQGMAKRTEKVLTDWCKHKYPVDQQGIKPPA